MKLVLFFFFSIANASSDSLEKNVVSMVPHGKMTDSLVREFSVKTQTGTKVQIELYGNGKLKTAKGSNLNAGDELEPGDGLISLSLAAQKLQSEGVSPRGCMDPEK